MRDLCGKVKHLNDDDQNNWTRTTPKMVEKVESKIYACLRLVFGWNGMQKSKSLSWELLIRSIYFWFKATIHSSMKAGKAKELVDK